MDDFLNAFVPMIPAVNEFFDKVLVMADDKALKENRLGLLQRIAALSSGVADLPNLKVSKIMRRPKGRLLFCSSDNSYMSHG